MNDKKWTYIVKVIKSCKNIYQLDIAKNWAESLLYGNDVDYHIELADVYLDTLHELNKLHIYRNQ